MFPFYPKRIYSFERWKPLAFSFSCMFLSSMKLEFSIIFYVCRLFSCLFRLYGFLVEHPTNIFWLLYVSIVALNITVVAVLTLYEYPIFWYILSLFVSLYCKPIRSYGFIFVPSFASFANALNNVRNSELIPQYFPFIWILCPFFPILFRCSVFYQCLNSSFIYYCRSFSTHCVTLKLFVCLGATARWIHHSSRFTVNMFLCRIFPTQPSFIPAIRLVSLLSTIIFIALLLKWYVKYHLSLSFNIIILYVWVLVESSLPTECCFVV